MYGYEIISEEMFEALEGMSATELEELASPVED